MSARRWYLKLFHLALIVLFLSDPRVPAVRAQDIPIDNFTVLNDLPNNVVTSIAQEANGQLWVATGGGIGKYRAGSFKTDDTEDLLKSMPVKVLAIMPGVAPQDKTSVFYVGGPTGLAYRDPSGEWTMDILTQNDLEPAAVQTLFASAEGILWIGTDNYLAICTKDNCHQVKVDGLPLPVNAITEDSSRKIWVGGESDEILILQDEKPTARITPKDGIPKGCSVNAILAGPTGDMWLGTNLGLVHLEGTQFKETISESQGLVSSQIFSLLHAHSGGIWVGSSEGLQRLKNSLWAETYTVHNHLAGAAVYALMYDQEGNLWAGTNGGLSRLKVSAWEKETDPLINLHSIKAILPNEESISYVVTEQGIAYRQPGESWQLIQGSKGQIYYCLKADPQGTVWVGGQHGLYMIIEGKLVADTRVPSNQAVSALLFDTDHSIFVGTDTGLLRLEDNLPAAPVEHIGKKTVSAIWKTSRGDLWVGLVNAGASRLRGDVWMDIRAEDKLLPSDFVYAGLENEDGSVWFATYSGVAILRPDLDPKSISSWSYVQIPGNRQLDINSDLYFDGRPGDELLIPTISDPQVNALLNDRSKPGMVWLGTNNGLNVIMNRFSSAFTTEDGLNSNSIQALAQSSDSIWVGTAFGLVYHKERSIAPLLSTPKWKVNGKLYDSDIEEPLKYSQQTATIDYQASDLNDMAGISYRLQIWQRKGNSTASLIKTVETLQPEYELDLSQGSDFIVGVTAYDREMNQTAELSSKPLTISQISPIEWLAGHPQIALLVMILAALAFGTLIYYCVRWARLRQQQAYPIVISTRISPNPITGTIEVDWQAHQRHKTIKGTHDFIPDLAAINKIERQLHNLTGRDPTLLKQLGEPLWQALFRGDDEKKLVDFKIGIWPARLYLSIIGGLQERSLPWEYAYGGSDLGHLMVNKQAMSLARLQIIEPVIDDIHNHTDQHKYVPLLISSQRKLRILIAWSNPHADYLDELRHQKEEAEAIAAVIKGARNSILIDKPTILPNAGWEAFEQEVRKGYDIVHFSGHGGIFEDENALFFQNEAGESRPRLLTNLVTLFEVQSAETHSRSLLVILNACRSAEIRSSTALMGFMESLTSPAGIPSAIGMGYSISEDSGIAFSKAFYPALLKNGQVDYAMTEGRKALANYSPERRDWGVPRLYLREEIDKLFEWS